MLATFDSLVQIITAPKRALSIDAETTGLDPRRHKAFMISFAWEEEGQNKAASWVFGNADADRELMRLVCTKPKVLIGHNIVFELGFIRAQWGLSVEVPVYCTMVMARLQHNNHMSYSLANCAKRIGMEKGDLKEYMLSHKLYVGSAKDRQFHFDKVPMELTVPYCEQDALLSLHLYQDQLKTFRQWDAESPPIYPLVKLEMQTTKSLFEMQWRGLNLDAGLCQEALSYETARAMEAHAWMSKWLGREFVDSAKELADPLKSEGVKPGVTPKDGESFDNETLSRSESELARKILVHRDASKRAQTYFANFLAMTSSDGRLHPQIFQSGAASGRFSVKDPAAQTFPTDDETPYPVRRVFRADKDCKIVSMDYQAMELRMMADEADEEGLIHDIQNGVDFHQKLADMAGVSRDLGKRGRFLRLYGGGAAKMAKSLNIPFEKAQSICRALDRSNPNITAYSRRLIRHAEMGGVCTNAYGRRYQFASKWSYKFPNYRIQGSGADTLRHAINDAAQFINTYKRGNTYLMLPIHDELVMNVDQADMDLLPGVRECMIAAYKVKRTLSMDVSVAIGENLCDVKET